MVEKCLLTAMAKNNFGQNLVLFCFNTNTLRTSNKGANLPETKSEFLKKIYIYCSCQCFFITHTISNKHMPLWRKYITSNLDFGINTNLIQSASPLRIL